MKLKELNSDERPRERMMEKGAASLSNAELVAILLRTGTGRMNVVDVARALLKSGENKLTAIMTMPPEKMCEIDGIGKSKAMTVAAAFELGRRCALETAVECKDSITNPKAVYRIMIPELRGLDHEECWGLFLNRANYIISRERFSSGGIDSTVIDTKTIARKALEKKATSMILIHNHPSGNPYPGKTSEDGFGDFGDIIDRSRYNFRRQLLQLCGRAGHTMQQKCPLIGEDNF